ncbi:hypothetical protein Tco_0618360 [Tanacetum coccineum]
MRELREDTFSGNKNDDAYEHIEKVLDIVSLFNMSGVTHDAVGCDICGETHLDKECPLNEEVKGVKEVKYGEFGRSFPRNGRNGGRYRVDPPGYYTRVKNRPPFGEKKPNLEELINKHIEESTRKKNDNEIWMKIFQENTDINIRNQNAALKNLAT